MKIFDHLKNIFHAASDLTAAHTSGLDLTLPRARRLSTASLAASTTLPLSFRTSKSLVLKPPLGSARGAPRKRRPWRPVQKCAAPALAGSRADGVVEGVGEVEHPVAHGEGLQNAIAI